MGHNTQNGDDEFRDDKIFESMVKHIADYAEKNKDNAQLIIVNNGYPANALDSVTIIKEFDSDGTKKLPYGLIDDMGK